MSGHARRRRASLRSPGRVTSAICAVGVVAAAALGGCASSGGSNAGGREWNFESGDGTLGWTVAGPGAALTTINGALALDVGALGVTLESPPLPAFDAMDRTFGMDAEVNAESGGRSFLGLYCLGPGGWATCAADEYGVTGGSLGAALPRIDVPTNAPAGINPALLIAPGEWDSVSLALSSQQATTRIILILHETQTTTPQRWYIRTMGIH